jgi:hypothetical protein
MFRFTTGQCAPQLIERLQANGWHGQIVGPHGSGKSSLVATLIPWLQQAGREPVLYTLHNNERRLPSQPMQQTAACGSSPVRTRVAGREKRWTRTTQVIVDGYEQLGLVSRWRLHRTVRRARCGLLVTAHADSTMPRLVQLRPEPEMVWELVEQLLAAEPWLLGRDEVNASFARHQGNVREILCDLYNLYERLRRQHRKEW